MIKFPENSNRFYWTQHIKNKMLFYHLSSAQILRIFRSPDRREEGIAEDTAAAMKTRKKANRKDSEELWIMYQLASQKPARLKSKSSKVTMISAWRYPGKTKPGDKPPIPAEILDELRMEGLL
ncbi:MAG: hypothetical protein Q8P45_01520 [Candidatus Harrisonbacteria bacterium]|nr:hypothetical protein [Candidatus Harrisonbacteria bacterium]